MILGFTILFCAQEEPCIKTIKITDIPAILSIARIFYDITTGKTECSEGLRLINNIHFVLKEKRWHEFADLAGITLAYYHGITGNILPFLTDTCCKKKKMFFALDV